jgi:DNA-binding NarL/FixJ family response regulator
VSGAAGIPATFCGEDVKSAVIVEDLLLLRDGLTRLLSTNGFQIAAAVDTGPAFLEAIDACQPDVAVVDVRLPPTFTDEGLRAAIEARRRSPGFPVLILSQYVEQLYARELLSDGAGGVGYLLKDRVGDVGQFVEAVQRVADGGTAMDPEVISQILARRSRRTPLAELTPREREVLALMAEGRTNAAIARSLVITTKAVSKNIARIFDKLGLPPSDDDHRRVLAVLAYLNSGA